jgi:hypothetical protein
LQSTVQNCNYVLLDFENSLVISCIYDILPCMKADLWWEKDICSKRHKYHLRGCWMGCNEIAFGGMREMFCVTWQPMTFCFRHPLSVVMRICAFTSESIIRRSCVCLPPESEDYRAGKQLEPLKTHVLLHLLLLSSNYKIICDEPFSFYWLQWLFHLRINNLGVGGKNFHFSVSFRLALGPIQPPIKWVPGVERPGREADRSPPTSAEVKKIWVYTSTLPYIFTALFLIRQAQGHFTFK